MNGDYPWWQGKRGEWYVIVQGVLLALIVVSPQAGGQPAWPAPWSLLARAIGWMLMVLGAALAAAGVLALGGNFSTLPEPKYGGVLVESGVYRMVRHPIYAGLLVGSFGWGLQTNSLWTLALAAGLLLLFEFKARREEGQLALRFPEYADYRRRVSKFIPFVY